MLAINLCTRARPHLVVETIEKTLANMRDPDTVFVVSADEDDDRTLEALAPYLKRDLGVYVDIRPREDTVGAKYNRVLEVEKSADVYLVMVDYAPHITPGFDQKILEAARLFPDGIGVVYNHMANDTFPQINAVTKRWVDITGGIYPELFPYWFIDHWLDDLAKMTGRISVADVWIDTSKQRTRSTLELREPYFWSLFYDLCLLKRRDEANRLLHAMKTPGWHKAMLRSQYRLHERRSAAVNRIVRDAAWQMERSNGLLEHDERYLRVKAGAEAIAREQVPLLRDLRTREQVYILDEVEARESERRAA